MGKVTRRGKGAVSRMLCSQAGQSFTEYALILFLTALICLAGTGIFAAYLKGYLKHMSKVYSVPFP